MHADTDGTGWVDASHGDGVGGATLDKTMAFHGQSSEQLRFSGNAGTGRAAVANRGLGNEGLFFEGGKNYEGYFFANAATKSVNLVVSLEAWSVDGKTPTVLASSKVTVVAGKGWQMFNFSLTPSAGTECDGITPAGPVAKAANITCPVNGTYDPQGVVSDRTAHICVRCGGQFVLALETPGTVNLDYVYLSPGEWGRFKGLPVLADGVKWLQGAGVSLFRMGGSFCSGNNYFCEYTLYAVSRWAVEVADRFWCVCRCRWMAGKRWRGLPWTRPSAAAAWGHDFEGGWVRFDTCHTRAPLVRAISNSLSC